MFKILKKLCLNLVLLFLSFAMCLFLAEAFVRFHFRDITSTTNGSGYFTARWKKTVSYNRLGFREKEIHDKTPGMYRIAVVGDSIAFGQGVDVSDRFSDVIEALLNDKVENRYEVVNFSKPGNNTREHIDVLKNCVLPTNPDYIVLQWYMNDFEGNDTAGRPHPKELPIYWRFRLFIKNSALYYLINRQWVSMQYTCGTVRSHSDYMYDRFGSELSQERVRALSEMKAFMQICKQSGIPLAVILFPRIDKELPDGYHYDFLHDAVLAVCVDNDVVAVDLRKPLFKAYEEGKQLWVSDFELHPSDVAHEITAQEIMYALMPMWVDEKTRTI